MKKRINVDGDISRWGRFWNKWKDHGLVRTVIYASLGLILYLLMIGNIAPDFVDVQVGSRAEQDIISPVTVVDEEATERARERAAREVAPVYIMDPSITENQVANLERAFDVIKETLTNDNLSREEKRQQLKERIPYELSDEAYDIFLNHSLEEIETLKQFTRSIVYEIMYAGVKTDTLEAALQEVNNSLILSTLDSDLRKVSQEMAKASIVPNYVLDPEETERLRQEAREQVRPIEIREGEIIVAEGDIVTQEIYRKLGKVGLLSESANLYPYLGLALFIGLILAFIACYIHYSDLPIKKDNTQFLMYIVIFILNVVFLKVVSIGQVLDYHGIGFMAPVAFATMSMTMLLHQRIALFSSFLFGLIAAIILNGETTRYMDFTYGLVAMFSGAAGAFFLGNATRKTRILQAGFVVSVVTVCAVVTMIMLTQSPFGWLDLAQYVAYGLMSGILASVLTIGIMPFFEAAFGILSPMKLIELSNPNQPLLRKILLEAPGTYHHSVMVANLAEAAAEAVGANGLLARVGAYYHDVGKTKRPHFFIENQFNMDNPHDKIAPQLSATIITAHTRDGAQMLREHKFPKAICDIAEQHHGTTLLKYFYHKAKEGSDCQVNESDFRYDGPKAQFKESAIVGIADSVEAAVRSLSKPTPERIENIVRQIIKDRLEDGQFNECDLTLKELDTIAKVICETLKGIFHSRIEYPDETLRKAHPKGREDKQAPKLPKVENQS
ncbi:7TM receptor with intracellular metal dependent phosphohydrolase [Caldalkalibacillus thermarum TA2.A1]|uniref:7TM receptor with intracellular metal dependent phosphohydrolase n=1 Tax=Caldalkalibacillus thermarum (strain TA2.A1) TaxID=986075 RepID=F5L7L1_CALTT|nr:HDIG domain-containing metalloprotein [Caldalkalibacillus thermarum]EGL82655.1 7TM receptor with intracellular metal dependent phosphohydrolase [Caldalkalibacillus thermarum TA2.A1]QZT33373.1 HDIG domain-containing protein [Caldalkalibacillus thermarum TA2.A1]